MDIQMENGIFNGLEFIANEFLLNPDWIKNGGHPRSYVHLKNCQELTGGKSPVHFDAQKLIEKMFEKIQKNITDLKPMEWHEPPHKVNWNFSYRLPSDESAGKNKKKESKRPEVTLERAIIKAKKKYVSIGEQWTYQMPIAYNLYGQNFNNSSNVDLVRSYDDGIFDLIELKIGSNHPVFAAVEILQYGLAYMASREGAVEIGYKEIPEIFNAREIHLCVLAPPEFYGDYNFHWLQAALNGALEQFSSQKGYLMTFDFNILNLDWDPTHAPTELQLQDINVALNKITPFDWKAAVK